MSKFKILAVLFALPFLFSMVFAAETGSIEGIVFDEDGVILDDVTVVAQSASLLGQRTVLTGGGGNYRFPILPIGEYALTYSRAGYTTVRITGIFVTLGKIQKQNAILKKGEIVETVSVIASYPLLDTKSTDLSVNMTEVALDTIPTAARSFRDLTKYVPSITAVRMDTVDAAGSGYPSIRGEGQYGDNYLIDGLAVRDPAVKTTGTPLNFDAISEVQIITDAFSPEYGQALGGIVNVITKSGGNDFSGEVAWLYQDQDLAAEYQERIFATPSDFSSNNPYFNVGGPIIKDKLWYFFSYNRFDDETTYAGSSIEIFEGGQPINVGTLAVGERTDEVDSYQAKLTYAFNPNHTVSLSASYYEPEIMGLGSASRTPDARYGQTSEQKRLRFNYKGILTQNSILEFKWGFIDREFDQVPDSGSLSDAQYRNQDTGIWSHNAWRLTHDERERNDYALIYTHFLDTAGDWGRHEFKVGVEYHDLSQAAMDDWTGQGEDLFSNGFSNGTLYEFQYAEDPLNPGTFLRDINGNPFEIPTFHTEYATTGLLTNSSEEWGIFVQDRWELFDQLTLMLGFRADAQEAFNDQNVMFFEAKISDHIAPRFTATWNVKGEDKHVFKVGYGKFHDVTSTRFGEFANTRSSFSFREYGWVGAMDAPFTPATLHDPANWAFIWEQSPDSNPLDYTHVDSLPYVERYLVEYDRMFGKNYVLKLRAVDGKTRDLIDDVAVTIDDWRVINFDRKRRDYRSYEVEFNGRPTDYFQFDASWVHSSAKGTSPGQFELAGFLGTSGSGNNIGVFGDRVPDDPSLYIVDDHGFAFADFNGDGTMDHHDANIFVQWLLQGLGGLDGDDGWYGPLQHSIDDQIKLHARYQARKLWNIYFDAFLEWNSGYHWSKYFYQPVYGDFLMFQETVDDVFDWADYVASTPPYQQQRGVFKTDAFWFLDLAVGKKFDLAKDTFLEFRVEFFNLLNEQQPTAFMNQDVATFGEILARQNPRTVRLTARFGW
jgi:outer membrane receptor for ferrienterochelin and colicin